MDHMKRFQVATTEAEIDQLIVDGFNLNGIVYSRWSIIMDACKKGKLAVVQALVKHGVDPNYDHGCFRKPIDVAARQGHLKIVEYFISIGCDIADAIFEATRKGHIDVLDFLLSLKKDVNTKSRRFGRTPLEAACYHGNRKAFDLLMEAGALVNSENKTHPLIIMSTHLEDRFATQLAEQAVIYGADFNYREERTDYTPLYAACENNKIELVNFLTSLRCQVNTVHDNELFETPLILACARDNTEIVKLLIAAGADTKYVDRFGKQAIDYIKSEEIRNLLSS